MGAVGMLPALPVVYPAVIALRYDPTSFGMIVFKMCEVGMTTPRWAPSGNGELR